MCAECEVHTYLHSEGVCMSTSMHDPCKSLRGSVVEGSLVALVEKGTVSKDHRSSSGSPGSKKPVPILTLPRAVYLPKPFPEHAPVLSTLDPRLTSFCFCVKSAPPASQKMRQNWRIFYSLPPSEVGFG